MLPIFTFFEGRSFRIFLMSKAFYLFVHELGLNLDLRETVLPESGVGGDTVLAEVNQDVPIENSG